MKPAPPVTSAVAPCKGPNSLTFTHLAQQPTFLESARALSQSPERHSRTLRDVQERVPAVGKIQNPQHAEPFGVGEQPSRPQARFPFRGEIQIATVFLENRNRQPHEPPRIPE